MVVQFPSAGSVSGTGGKGVGRGLKRESTAREGLAPVTYLPGAQPSEAAREALARVEAIAESEGENDDAESERHSHRARRAGAGRDDDVAERAVGGMSRTGRDRSSARAGNVAIHQLARRGMSRWELEQVLAKRDVDEQTATAELDRLESIGLVDDASLAVSVVYTLHTRKGAGRAAIEQELRRRHLAPEVIEEAMAELDRDDELERALELATTRARQLTSVDYEVAVRRLSGYLARKGYDGETVRSAVRRALEGHPHGSSNGRGTVRFR